MTLNSLAIDNFNSQVEFSVQKLGFLTVNGTLDDFTGEAVFDKNKLEQSHFNVCVSAVTIDTGSSKRDEHLKSEDFFDVNQHPKICIQSTSISSDSEGYQVQGNLSILGISKAYSIPFSLEGNIFQGEFSLNRLDFNLGKKFPAFFIGKTIKISIKCKIND